MKKRILLGGLGAGLSFVPFVALAASTTAVALFSTLHYLLNTFVIPLLITLAVVYFIWGVIQYTVSQDEEKKKTARAMIIQGLIGLFVIIAFWGIIGIIVNTFGVGATSLDAVTGGVGAPCVPLGGKGGC